MGFLSVLSFAHELAAARIRPGDCAVDATAGNGVDTLFLARAVGPGGRVHAFDIQEAALASTAARLEKELPDGSDRVVLHLASHDEMKLRIPEELHETAAAVMFNLGYLPGADHAVITTPATTLPALEAALELLRRGGVLTIAVYPGHDGGLAEAEAVEAWASGLPQSGFQSMSYRFLNQRNRPPYLLAVEKR
ncbi:class I SAM-dependent methyltransferase [Gorillibacterium sp. sgz5001074]|uniref:tRNA (mnm(5)s(2)U34)-methyltransferase n=1 Tax=Gorillibacterium sp. sgz5001074 TaxID=3446695 RepID=UPI003F672D2E